MVIEGDQIVVGDVGDVTSGLEESVVEYEVLCRRHYMRRMTSYAARVTSQHPLPFEAEIPGLCPIPGSERGTAAPSGHAIPTRALEPTAKEQE